ncbi:MAG: hypothetical protein JXQ99_27840 [Hyphomicrobiaceae bacterium]
MALSGLDVPRSSGFIHKMSQVKRFLGRQLLTMQYARMLQIMTEMSDPELEALGISRADIPRHAYECIYGDQA